MLRFILLCLVSAFAGYLVLTSPQFIGLGFAVGVVLIVVGLVGYAASFASWVKPHL